MRTKHKIAWENSEVNSWVSCEVISFSGVSTLNRDIVMEVNCKCSLYVCVGLVFRSNTCNFLSFALSSTA